MTLDPLVDDGRAGDQWIPPRQRSVAAEPVGSSLTKSAVVEAVANGRRAIGIDLNPVAEFVTLVKTTPLSDEDELLIEQWARDVAPVETTVATHLKFSPEEAKNLPEPVARTLKHALEEATRLPLPRQERFARCALLRLGQWAVDCKMTVPSEERIRAMLMAFVDEMLGGLEEFVQAGRLSGIPKNKLTGRRTILQRSAIGLDEDARLQRVA